MRVAPLLLLATTLAGSLHAQIMVGQSASLTAGSAQHSREFVAGAQACFNAVNRKGGIQGERIELKTVDDKGDPKLAAANTERLVREDRAQVLFGYTTRPTAEAGLGVAQTLRRVFFAPASGGETLRRPDLDEAFHFRPGYAAEYGKIVDTLTTTGITRFAVVVNQDDTSDSNRRAVEAALTRHGLALTAAAAVPRNEVRFAAARDAMLRADPQVLVVAASGKSVAPLLLSLRDKGFHGQFATMSFVGATLPGELGREARGLIVTSIVPLPNRVADPLIRSAMRDIRTERPGATLSLSSVEGYAAACTLAEVLRRIKPTDRGERMRDAIESLGAFELAALGLNLTFDRQHHTGSDYVDVNIVASSGQLLR